jgi:hypothetical protein
VADRDLRHPDRRRRISGDAVGDQRRLGGRSGSSGRYGQRGLQHIRQVGGAVAIAVFGALIANPDTIDRGLRLSLGIAAVLILLAALNSLRIRPRTEVAV